MRFRGEQGVTLDRDDELGEVTIADDPPELLLGNEHAGGGPAAAHVTVAPTLHVAPDVADDLDHALAGVGRAERLGELAIDPEPDQQPLYTLARKLHSEKQITKKGTGYSGKSQ